MDRIVVVLGAVMILMTAYVAVVSGPPVGEALRNAVLPDTVSFLAITTLIGGTVGGYITYAGAHRLLDSGLTGPEHVGAISRSSVIGIMVTGVMRVLLFTVAFIAVSTAIFLLIGSAPVTLLVFAGAFNGLIPPIGFTVILWVAWRRRDLLGGYRYPGWLLGIGVLAWLLSLYMGYAALGGPAKL